METRWNSTWNTSWNFHGVFHTEYNEVPMEFSYIFADVARKFYEVFYVKSHGVCMENVTCFPPQNSMTVHLIKLYCLLSLLYSCKTWHARSDDIRSANIAYRIVHFGRCSILFGQKISSRY